MHEHFTVRIYTFTKIIKDYDLLMYKTASPYVKELLKGEINWMPFSFSTLETAIAQDKPIFVHIGNISDIEQRNRAYTLFRNPEVVKTINNNFIAIAIDTEDVPEAYLVGMDLLLINEQRISRHINIFSLPGIKPITSFSSLLPDDFLQIAQNIIRSFKEKRGKLELASTYLTRKLKLSGIVTKKEEPSKIDPKILHAYIRSWSSRFLNLENKKNRQPYTISPRNLTFILEYAWKYQIKEYLKFAEETLVHLYYSAVFDPIDGGVFSASADYTFRTPSYEKSLYENANAAILFSTAYKYFKKRIFKEAAERITEFLQTNMNIQKKGYITFITLNRSGNESTYYKYTIQELKESFPGKFRSIATALGMNLAEEPQTAQIISNTPKYWDISPDELEMLKKIRNRKKNELIYDRRIMTGYNCKVALAMHTLANNSPKHKREEYIKLAEDVIENISNNQRKGKIHLYKYISSTKTEYSISDLYDYSLYLNCLLGHYILTKNEKYNSMAKDYAAYIIFNHYQPSTGMFTKTGKYEAAIPVKRAPVIDYNTLSSNSIMADNMLLMYSITGNEIYINTFKQQIYNILPHMVGSGPFMSGWGMQLLNYLSDHLPIATKEQ